MSRCLTNCANYIKPIFRSIAEMLNSTIEVVGGTVVFKVLGGVESTLQETDGRDVLISEPHHQQTQQHCQDSR